MPQKNIFTKILAIDGVVLVWFPILTPVIFTVLRLLRGGSFMFDYLMPAEFFPVALIGGLLLYWAARRADTRQGIIGWSLAIAAGVLLAGQMFAISSGLASGDTEPVGLQWALVVASLVIYILAIITLAVGGVQLLRDLFKPIHPVA